MNDKSDGISDILACELQSARSSGNLVDVGRFPTLSMDDAYSVQTGVAEYFGPVGGFKVACKPSLPNIMAPILKSDVVESGSTVEVRTDSRVAVELEIGFLVTRRLPAREDPRFREKVRKCVLPVVAIEIVGSRLTDMEVASPTLRLADNQLNMGLVVGSPVEHWQDLSLGQVRGSLKLNGKVVFEQEATVPGGCAFDNFLSLAQMVGDHCGGLKVGQYVITGSLNGMPFIELSCKIEGEIQGLGSVSVTLCD